MSTARGDETDGTFLVRDQTGSDVDFALSFLHEKQCYHFFIKRVKEIWFCFDGGPLKQGMFWNFILRALMIIKLTSQQSLLNWKCPHWVFGHGIRTGNNNRLWKEKCYPLFLPSEVISILLFPFNKWIKAKGSSTYQLTPDRGGRKILSA